MANELVRQVMAELSRRLALSMELPLDNRPSCESSSCKSRLAPDDEERLRTLTRREPGGHRSCAAPPRDFSDRTECVMEEILSQRTYRGRDGAVARPFPKKITELAELAKVAKKGIGR